MVSQSRRMHLFKYLLVGVLVMVGVLGAPSRASAAGEPLKIGISVLSKPCTFSTEGHWRGSFHEVWSEVAANANMPFQLVEIPSFQKLLDAGQNGQVDVALGCINMTPDRLSKYRFSVAIQEDGISVLIRKEPSRIWQNILRTLWSIELLALLGGILAFIFGAALLLWYMEGYSKQESTRTTGRLRTFAKLFQILLSGPGTNVIATRARGNALIGVVYFFRIIVTSVLVSYVSVNIIKRSAQEVSNTVKTIGDLAGKTVSVGEGSVSEHWVGSYNAVAGAGSLQINLQRINNLERACGALIDGQVDAVIADNAQIQYYLSKVNPRAPLQVAIRNIHRQSQGLIFAPQLSAEAALRINQAIARLKENGTVDNIRKRWLPDE